MFSTSNQRIGTLVILGSLAAVPFLTQGDSTAIGGPLRGDSSHLLGGSAGAPVAFELLTLPPVVLGWHNDPASLQRCAFAPTFDDLVSGETVITSEAQMKHVWRRLFAEHFDPSLVDFERDFVVLMGGGFLHPMIDFRISSVELFEVTFENELLETYVNSSLAIAGTTYLPGPPPPKMDPIPRVSAVTVSRQYLGNTIFSRLVIAFP